MIVLVEATALEGDTDGAEHLGDVFLRAGSTARAFRGRVIGKGLDLLELFSTLLAAVLVGRHVFSGRYQRATESIGPYPLNNNLCCCVPISAVT